MGGEVISQLVAIVDEPVAGEDNLQQGAVGADPFIPDRWADEHADVAGMGGIGPRNIPNSGALLSPKNVALMGGGRRWSSQLSSVSFRLAEQAAGQLGEYPPAEVTLRLRR
jgi:hypothetical protein